MADSRGESRSSPRRAKAPATKRAKKVTPPVETDTGRNLAALDSMLAADLTGRASVLAEAARTAAQAIDQDVTPCRDCRQRGTPALASLLSEYRRTLDALAGVLAEEADDESEAVVFRLAGGMRP